MSQIRTYLDASVIMNAWKGQDDNRIIAMQILDDDHRHLLTSRYLQLELLPKPTFYKNHLELDFINRILSRAEQIADEPRITKFAVDLAGKYDLAPLDALHIASALVGRAMEFLSFEKPGKPLYRLPSDLMRVVALSTLAG